MNGWKLDGNKSNIDPNLCEIHSIELNSKNDEKWLDLVFARNDFNLARMKKSLTQPYSVCTDALNEMSL